MNVKYIVMFKNKETDRWSIYTSTAEQTDLPFFRGQHDEQLDGVQYVYGFKLPMKFLGVTFVDSWVWKNKEDVVHSIAFKQEDIGVNINMLPDASNKWN